MIWIITVFIYVFFVYGIIEFIKNVFNDVVRYKHRNDEHKIEVIIDDPREVEYIISSLKKNFNHIVLVSKQQDSDIQRIASCASNDIRIEYRIESNLGEAKKSQEDF